MIKTLRSMISILAIVTMAVLVVPGVAQAQEPADTGADSNTANSQVTDDYTYVTPKDCSLTLLTRRSLQLYDNANDDVSLTKAQTIYAETNIVQAMGPRLLDVNERVVVPFELVDRYATSSQELSARILALWERYVGRARFELESIKTVAQVETEENAAEEKAKGPEENTSGAASDGAAAQEDTDSSNRLWWALLIGAGLYTAWAVSNRRRQTVDE